MIFQRMAAAAANLKHFLSQNIPEQVQFILSYKVYAICRKRSNIRLNNLALIYWIANKLSVFSVENKR